MDQRARRLSIDAAEWDLRIGWLTGAGISALRGFAVSAMLLGSAPLDAPLLAQLVVQLLLALLFTFGVYRGRVSAAVGLMVLWGVGYVYGWYAMGRLLPPLGLVGIAIWYGLYRGLRGARALAAHPDAAASAV